jgi:hypothetical protein
VIDRCLAVAVLALASVTAYAFPHGEIGAPPSEPVETPASEPVAAPPTAEDPDVRQQLEAQKAINRQLRARVQELENQQGAATAVPALDATPVRSSVIEPESAQSDSAIQEALIDKGFLLLPSRSFRLASELAWVHTGADALLTRSDDYTASLTAQAGLPWRMMLSANVPYTRRETSSGSNSGAGDLSLALSAALTGESAHVPALLASVAYSDDNGHDPFAPVPIGFGFRTLGVTLSALKRVEPLALYGGVGYTHPFARQVDADNFLNEPAFHGRIAPGDAWSYRLGASLAATPAITLDASLAGAFIDRTDVRSQSQGDSTLAQSTLVFLGLGADFLLSRDLALLANAAAGITQDSPDAVLSITLSYRFHI